MFKEEIRSMASKMNYLHRISCFTMLLVIFLSNDAVYGKVSIDHGLYDIEIPLDSLLEAASGASADTSQNDPGSIDIASFNVQVFGRTKMRKRLVADHLTKIILRYDLILIQEIRDSSGTAIEKLLNKVNSKCSGREKYEMVISKRLGRTSSKEQYAFMYRSDIIQATSNYTYDDSVHDIFQREPFVVTFTSNVMAISSFVAIGIHTSPSDATSEISHLVDVYDDAVKRTNIKDAIIMGDFNAGCDYVQDWEHIKLATDRRFYWLINDLSDTTTKSTECPYDRFVIAGTRMLDVVEPLATGVFHFDTEYNLNYDQATKISDHYPIQMKIRSKNDYERISLRRVIEIKDKGMVATIPTPPLPALLTSKGFSMVKNFKEVGGLESFIIRSAMSTKTESIKNLDQLHAIMGRFISTTQVQAAKRHLNEISMVEYLPKNNTHYQTLKDYYQTVPFLYVVMAKCKAKHARCILALDVEDAF